MISIKTFVLLSVCFSVTLSAMSPQEGPDSGIIRIGSESTLVRRLNAAFDHTTQKYSGTHQEATAIAAGGILACAFNQNLKPRDFRRDMLQGILNDGTPVNKEYEFASYMDYPLHVACRSDDHEDIVTELLARGANIEQISPHECHTILHSCANAPKNLHKIITLLGPAKTKLLINRKNSSYLHTPLHLAADNVNKDCIAILLAHGAEVNGANTTNNTPLAILIRAQQWIYDTTPEQTFTLKVKNCIRELLLRGADVHMGATKQAYKNSDYKTAVRQAFEECGKLDQLAYLEDTDSK